MPELDKKRTEVSKPQMLVVIGVRWYKDGMHEEEVKERIKALSEKSIDDIEKAFNDCFGIPE